MPENSTLTPSSEHAARREATGPLLQAAESRRQVNLLAKGTTRVSAGVALLVAVALFAAGDSHTLSVVNFGLIAAIAAIGLNVAMGTTGILSLGHAVFVGFGAFTAAVASDHGLPFPLAALAAMAVAALASLSIGPLALRLSGLYLAVGTIGIAFVGEHLFVNLRSLTGGGAGRMVDSPSLFGMPLSQDAGFAGRLVTGDMKWFLLLCLVTAVVGASVATMQRLRWGRAFRAVRDNESSAAAAGIPVNRVRITAFALSAALGGLSGALLAGYLRYLNPETFGLEASIQYLAMIIVGGLGSVSGAVIGGILIIALPTVLNDLSTALGLVEQASGTSSDFNTGTLALVAYGVIIVGVMCLAPRGIAGGFSQLARAVERRSGRPEPQTPDSDLSSAREGS